MLSFPLSVLFYFVQNRNFPARIVIIFFSAVFSFMILLNLTDIFYYPYALQRSTTELLYIIRNPFRNFELLYFLTVVVIILIYISITGLFYFWISHFYKDINNKSKVNSSVLIFFTLCFLFFFTGTNKWLPTYPLLYLKSNELPLVQNSFHNFFYSLYRRSDTEINIPGKKKIVSRGSDGVSLLNINMDSDLSKKRNIVLFIMESVPHDFFNASSPYKVKMPFLDSLVSQSTFFNKSYSYSRQSNKGITAILAGIPTITEVPLYHSGYSNIPMTHIGNVLESQGYHSSFFIGDNYDDFGFAKCINWLGIQQYYCMSDVPGYKKMQKHTMGLHDHYMLNFMVEKLNKQKEPFLTINYNISTHYPYDTPSDFDEPFPDINRTSGMKSMSYYNYSLESFFKNAKKQSWFNNTVFIFCSDHWMLPDINNKMQAGEESSFRIALFIYDPQNTKPAINNYPVSQFDVFNTILHYSNYKKPYISYGKNLLQSESDQNRVIFSRNNNIIYQVFDSSYVLGYNVIQGKVEYCYNYELDKTQIYNLAADTSNVNVKRLTQEMKDYLYTAYRQYEQHIVQ